MRCDQCKYWDKKESDEWETRRAGFRSCNAIQERWKIEDKAVEGIFNPSGPHLNWRYDASSGRDVTDDEAYNRYEKMQVDAVKEQKAFVVDGSQFMAELNTAPDFFCAKFDKYDERTS